MSKISFSFLQKSQIPSKIPPKFRISVQRYLTSFNQQPARFYTQVNCTGIYIGDN